jgi:hypothetical protein
MAATGLGPIKQALVRALRDHSALYALVGSDGINEGVNPRGEEGEESYPQIVYNVISSVRDYDATGLLMQVEIDVWSSSRSQVEAHNLDQLVAEALEVPLGDFMEGSSGQTSLLCHRVVDLSFVDIDGAGNKVYQMGGSYRIWTDQARTA